MRVARLIAWIAATGATASGAQAAASPELRDLAARVQYGYYHGEPHTVAAADAGLERLGDSPGVAYFRDFAALRLVQLGIRDRDTVRRLAACARRQGGGAATGSAAAEAWALAAACALEAGDERRMEQALAAARAVDADHPRLALVEAWRLKAGMDDAIDPATLAAKWGDVVAAFDAFEPSIDDPGWGQAEALVALADSAWQRGETRAARDLVERALLLAPDYRAAVALRSAILEQRSGSRAP
jgi:tetratricopeptide (TPR) repeat protein